MGVSATSFAAKWRSGPTQVIRVPESMAERLMAIARHWDTTGIEPLADHVLAEPSPVYQLGLPNIPRLEPGRPVNVSSVPQLSPFRYPGGKTWLIPTIRAWLLHTKPKRLFEPFAGGAIVSLTAASENLVDEVVFCELDDGVAAVWKAILSDDCHWLIDRILSFDLNEKQYVKSSLHRQATRKRVPYRQSCATAFSVGESWRPALALLRRVRAVGVCAPAGIPRRLLNACWRFMGSENGCTSYTEMLSANFDATVMHKVVRCMSIHPM